MSFKQKFALFMQKSRLYWNHCWQAIIVLGMMKLEADTSQARLVYAQNRLIDALKRHIPQEGVFPTAIPGTGLARRDHPGISEHRFDKPIVSLLLQGSKNTTFAEHEYRMHAGDILTVGVDMPSSSLIVQASPELPLFTFFFQINQQTISDLIFRMGLEAKNIGHSSGIMVSRADVDFMEAVLKLVLMLDRPEQIPHRSDIALLDLHYLLLTGMQSGVLCEIYGNGKCGHQLFSAIDYLRNNLDTPVSASELSKVSHMSPSTLYRHFKALTGLSPLQYHKQLRLHEARRLIIGDKERASTAAYKTGYESVSQFSREYRRLFGEPPGKSRK